MTPLIGFCSNMFFMIPISIYIHFPWCLKKCPYCDFHSCRINAENLPEKPYLEALLVDLENDLKFLQGRTARSVYFGGGTPSLFSPIIFEKILDYLAGKSVFGKNTEITLEVNPGTITLEKARCWKGFGINRLSIGIQSFQDEKLKALGRIHNSEEAVRAVEIAKEAGFSNINLDLMFGLPNQTLTDALYDLNTVFSLEPTHLSWYELTLEPGTVFFKNPPILPNENEMLVIQEKGLETILKNGFNQYEVSAYSKGIENRSQHNLNYWQFGDYLGIGAGAHGKITDLVSNKIIRYSKIENSKKYLAASNKYQTNNEEIFGKNLVFEFMLNALRLYDKIPITLFTDRTGLDFNSINSIISVAKSRELMDCDEKYFWTTPKGKTFLNELLILFN